MISNSVYGKIQTILLCGRDTLNSKTAEKVRAISEVSGVQKVYLTFIIDRDNMSPHIFDIDFRSFLMVLQGRCFDQHIEHVLNTPLKEMKLDMNFWEGVYKYIVKAYPLDKCTLLMGYSPPHREKADGETSGDKPAGKETTGQSGVQNAGDNISAVSDAISSHDVQSVRLARNLQITGDFIKTQDKIFADLESSRLLGPSGDWGTNNGTGLVIPKPGQLGALSVDMIPELVKLLQRHGVIKEYESSDYFVKGGDIIVASDFIMIGRDTLYEPANTGVGAPRDPDDFIKGFRKQFGLAADFPVIVMGPDAYDPTFWGFYYHLDLYLLYVGWHDGKHRFLMASIDQRMIDHNPDEQSKIWATECAKMLDSLYDKFSQLDPDMFHFTRVPMMQFGNSCYPYQNALVEIVGDEKNIILPSYFTDRDVISPNTGISDSIFSQMHLISIDYLRAFINALPAGFRVRMAGDYTLGISMTGALHCSTNILLRAR